MVYRCQVRDLHSLGRLFRAGVRGGECKRRNRVRGVVLEFADRRNEDQRQARPRRDDAAISPARVWRPIPVLRFRANVPGGVVRPGSMGRRLRAVGGKVCGADVETSRRLHALAKRRSQPGVGPPVEQRGHWSEARPGAGPERGGRRRGLHMGIYYSLYEWYNPLWLADRKRYVAEHMFPQFKDVVNHVKPSIIFSDGEWEMPSEEWRSPELLAWLLNDSPVKDDVVIDDRWGKDTRHKHGGYYTTEYTSGMQQGAHPWEESRGMGYSYGYNRMETVTDYHSDRELLMMLIDIVSRGGNLLLDIGPTADGRIPVIMEERLIQIGNWLRPNGEAIYGTRSWRHPRQFSAGAIPKFEEKEFMSDYDITKLVDTPPTGYARVDAFLTAKDDAVYAILPRRPGKEIVIEDVETAAGVKVTLLETGQALQSTRDGKSLRVQVPDGLPFRQAYVLKLAGAR